MIVYRKNRTIYIRNVHGRGLVNNLINKLPIEFHLPGYQFCGPGTKLEKRLQGGDRGINPFDAACRVLDIAYAQSTDINKRHHADKELIEKAWARVNAKDSSLGEKANAYMATNAMKIKLKFGMGMENKKSKKICATTIFNNAVKAATIILKNEKLQDINSAIITARKLIVSRIIHVLKVECFLHLTPILTALGALAALASGGSAIARAVDSTKVAKQKVQENARHNKSIDVIAMAKGLYIKPHKKIYGISSSSVTKN